MLAGNGAHGCSIRLTYQPMVKGVLLSNNSVLLARLTFSKSSNQGAYFVHAAARLVD